MTMNHNSTTAADEIQGRIADAIMAAAAIRAQRDAADEAADRQRAMQAHAKLMGEWDRPLTLIYQAVPEWAHPYINEPREPHCKASDHDLTYGWVEITLPGCTPIRAWADRFVVFEAGHAAIDIDEEFGNWYAVMRYSNYRRTTWSIDSGERDFAVAVEAAHDHHVTLLQLQAEAERRNAEMSAPTPAPKPAQIDIPMDPAAKVLACIAELDLDLETTFERGLLYELITIAAELRAIRDGIEDIAAVVVANDPKQESKQ